MREALRAIEDAMPLAADDFERGELLAIRGAALFELGDVVGSTTALEASLEVAESAKPGRQASAISLFSKSSQFELPEHTLPTVSRLRLAALTMGDLEAMGSLHLVVARLEALRGLCITARRHLELSRRLIAGLDNSRSPVGAAHLVDAGLELIAGNLDRAGRSASLGVAFAQERALNVFLAGSLTNLATVALFGGKTDQARDLLNRALELCTDLSLVRASAADALAQLELFGDDLTRFKVALEVCSCTFGEQRLPARSWTDLSHQLTRCTYHERLEEWDVVLDICKATDPELERRRSPSPTHLAPLREGASPEPAEPA